MKIVKTYVPSESPKSNEKMGGWVFLDGDWWLTWDALKKEFHSARTLWIILLSTYKNGVNEGKLRSKTFQNSQGTHSVVYNLEDMRKLIKKSELY